MLNNFELSSQKQLVERIVADGDRRVQQLFEGQFINAASNGYLQQLLAQLPSEFQYHF